ncbi:hypothetical protein J3Q64DRAFT_1680670 [Phycomyces blakesleeanus]|uniref:Arrestin C-terminal-like domain-containing protein n=2 Tax=Phycomyces blakesleeanus TaxID=4837 RepID=A0A162U315_PHYB8|nr:hypothetical protein PHYBLDRAFT_169310 [Phycomyces blakesleeanus NRRL 1555(-)]OAD73052.1 hypothetical protein PHYBLDRAFT_169310 [Phycomyces blakesleeanus NRRL 1555(-)]|eukprot:XP_018291092.1 hypothetical protein PHYBLDRAFT_169310 [Phycomyces blakesleeanus NRRL 1555(-)]
MFTSRPTTANTMKINLVSEHGTTSDQTFYCPGSVIQGSVSLSFSKKVDPTRVRLVFEASEGINLSTATPGAVSNRLNNLFRVQSTLWEKNESDQLTESDYTFPFNIQLPMVQFPPSMDEITYRCVYRLTAYLDLSKSRQGIITLAQKKINFVPFIETAILKSPLTEEITRNGIRMVTKLTSLNYVSGDKIPISLRFSTAKNKPVSLSIKLSQIINFITDEEYPLEKTTMVSSSRVLAAGTTYHETCLEIPSDTSPTFDYGRMISVSYILKITMGHKYCAGLLQSSEVSVELPIHIGTLGCGIRPPDDLKMYTIFLKSSSARSSDSTSDFGLEPIPPPRFLKLVEYENALPVYTPERLPDYSSVRSGVHV